VDSANVVRQLRVALTVADLERALQFYRDGLGLDVALSWATPDGQGVVLSAGEATLELIDHAQAQFIDRVEVGERVSGAVRLALEFADVDAAVRAGRAAGARLLHAPVETPWRDRNARLVAPDGMQLTLFQPLDEPETETAETPLTDAELALLRRAIAISQRAREHGNHPFGALLADANGQVLLEAENTVVTEKDCTGHAETNLMRLASRQFTPAVLDTCTLYSSAEPCAMCAGAIHWGNVGRLVYGVGAPSLYELIGNNDDRLYLSCREVFLLTSRPIEVIGPALEDEALAAHTGFWTA
jgi:tRNA(Arg) A34 adenosine deaminase TadA/predicted enzyme related to lactoylglutathione lyase